MKLITQMINKFTQNIDINFALAHKYNTFFYLAPVIMVILSLRDPTIS